MATLNINKIGIHNKSGSLPLSLKKTCSIEQYYRHCSGTVMIFEKVNFILYVSCNNEIKLILTLKFTLAKVIFK